MYMHYVAVNFTDSPLENKLHFYYIFYNYYCMTFKFTSYSHKMLI